MSSEKKLIKGLICRNSASNHLPRDWIWWFPRTTKEEVKLSLGYWNFKSKERVSGSIVLDGIKTFKKGTR